MYDDKHNFDEIQFTPIKKGYMERDRELTVQRAIRRAEQEPIRRVNKEPEIIKFKPKPQPERTQRSDYIKTEVPKKATQTKKPSAVRTTTQRSRVEERRQNYKIEKGYTPRTRRVSDSFSVKKGMSLRYAHEYDDMKPTNINVNIKMKSIALTTCALVVCAGIGLAAHFAWFKGDTAPTPPPTSISTEVSADTVDSIIYANQINYEDSIYIIRQATNNMGGIVNTTQHELEELGADSIVIRPNDDVVETINNIKNSEEYTGRQIVVVSYDGVCNNTEFSNVIMTNYNNDAPLSSDGFALAVEAEAESEYGISTITKCGKKDVYSGERTYTSLERTLINAGLTDVVAITVAPNPSYLERENAENNIASSVVGGIARYESMTVEERQADYIHRVTFGDTLNGLAGENGVSADYITSTNSDFFEGHNGLQYNSSLVVMRKPQELTGFMTVNNPAVTTNPNDITTSVMYYEVQSGDTVSQIATSLGISQDDLVLPNANADNIQVGQQIGYEKTTGPILVTKLNQNHK